MLSMLLAVAAMVCVISAIEFDGPCYLVPVPMNNNQRNNSVEVPASCKTGTIGWDFPMGVLRVHLAQRGKSFNLCLEDSSLTMIGGVHVITGGTHVEVPVPTKGNLTCTQSVGGEAAFLVSSGKIQVYFTYIDYSVAFNTADAHTRARNEDQAVGWQIDCS